VLDAMETAPIQAAPIQAADENYPNNFIPEEPNHSEEEIPEEIVEAKNENNEYSMNEFNTNEPAPSTSDELDAIAVAVADEQAQAEQRLAQQQAQQEAQRLAQQQAEQDAQRIMAQQQAAEAQRIMAQQQAEQQEAQRLEQEAAEAQRVLEQQRLEQARLNEAQRVLEVERLEQEQKAAEEQRRFAEQEAEAQRVLEQQRLEQERKAAEEQRRLEQEAANAQQAREKQRVEQERVEQERKAEEERQALEKQRLEQEQKATEEKQALEKQRQEQEQKAAEEKRQLEEQQRALAEQQRKAAEELQQAQAALAALQQKMAEELAEQQRKAEQERVEQEQKAEEERQALEKRKAELEDLQRRNQEERARLQQEYNQLQETIKKEREQAQADEAARKERERAAMQVALGMAQGRAANVADIYHRYSGLPPTNLTHPTPIPGISPSVQEAPAAANQPPAAANETPAANQAPALPSWVTASQARVAAFAARLPALRSLLRAPSQHGGGVESDILSFLQLYYEVTTQRYDEPSFFKLRTCNPARLLSTIQSISIGTPQEQKQTSMRISASLTSFFFIHLMKLESMLAEINMGEENQQALLEQLFGVRTLSEMETAHERNRRHASTLLSSELKGIVLSLSDLLHIVKNVLGLEEIHFLDVPNFDGRILVYDLLLPVIADNLTRYATTKQVIDELYRSRRFSMELDKVLQASNPMQLFVRIRNDGHIKEQWNTDYDVYLRKPAPQDMVVCLTQTKKQYAFEGFTRIFLPDETNAGIAKQMTGIQERLQKKQNVLMMGYGASGSGKTSSLIYFSKTKEDGILLHLCNRMTATFPTLRLSCTELYQMDHTAEIMKKESGPIPFIVQNGSYQLSQAYSHENHHPYRTRREDKAGTEIESPITTFPQGTPLGSVMVHLVDTDRFIRATLNNPQSSRSHCLVTMELQDANGASAILGILDAAGKENTFTCEKDETRLRFLEIKDPNQACEAGRPCTYYARSPEDDRISGGVYGVDSALARRSGMRSAVAKSTPGMGAVRAAVGSNTRFQRPAAAPAAVTPASAPAAAPTAVPAAVSAPAARSVNVAAARRSGMLSAAKAAPGMGAVRAAVGSNTRFQRPAARIAATGVLISLQTLFDGYDDTIKGIKVPSKGKRVEQIASLNRPKGNANAATKKKLMEALQTFNKSLENILKSYQLERLYQPLPFKADAFIGTSSPTFRTAYQSERDALVQQITFYAQEICSHRREEGYFINDSLDELRNMMSYLLNEHAAQQMDGTPRILDPCLMEYCEDLDTCFAGKEASSPPRSVIFDTVKEKMGDLSQLLLSVFCMVNLSPLTTPPAVPYVDINDIKRHMLAPHRYGTELRQELGQLLEEIQRDERIQWMKSLPMPKEERSIFSCIEDILTRVTFTAYDLLCIQECIRMVEKNNAPTLMGTLEFMSQLTKQFKSSNLCRVPAHDDATIQKYIAGATPLYGVSVSSNFSPSFLHKPLASLMSNPEPNESAVTSVNAPATKAPAPGPVVLNESNLPNLPSGPLQLMPTDDDVFTEEVSKKGGRKRRPYTHKRHTARARRRTQRK